MDIPGLRRPHLHGHGAADRLGDELQEVTDGGVGSASDVQHGTRFDLGRGSTRCGVDDITHEGEVPDV